MIKQRGGIKQQLIVKWLSWKEKKGIMKSKNIDCDIFGSMPNLELIFMNVKEGGNVLYENDPHWQWNNTFTNYFLFIYLFYYHDMFYWFIYEVKSLITYNL